MKTTKIRSAASIALLAMPLVCSSQVVFRSLEEMWQYSEAHNITIRTARYETDKASYAKKQSFGALLPQINATGSYTDNLALQTTLIPADLLPGGSPGAYRELQFGQQFVYAGGLAAQMSIVNLQNWYNARASKITEELNRDSLANTRKNIYSQIATQFYSYLLMQEAYRLSLQSAGIADSVFLSVSNKYKEGTVNEANVDIAKLNLERAQQNQLVAQYQMLTAKNNIRALLGLSVSDSLSIESSLQNNLSADAIGTFTEDPAVRIAAIRNKLSLSQYRAANAGFAPTINILYNYSTQRFDKTFEPFSHYTGTAAWFPAQYWALQATLPIFTGGSRWFNIQKNRISYRESSEMYEFAKTQSAINDENIRLNYKKATAVLVKAENVMKLSYDNYRHVSYRYESGLSSLDERLTAFKDFIDYQNQYLNSLSDMLVQLYQVRIRQKTF